MLKTSLLWDLLMCVRVLFVQEPFCYFPESSQAIPACRKS